MTCLIQNIITSEPQLQFQWKNLQNVALVAGFNSHTFSSLNHQKREFYGHFSGAHLLKKSNIWKYHETNISCAHILELYIFPWRVQTVALDCAWRFKYMYLGWLKHGGTGTILHVNYRHRSKFMHSDVRHKVHEYTAVTCQSSKCFHLKYFYWVCFLRLWIFYKGTKPLCLGPLKHGETWSICHKNCIYLSTTMQTQTGVIHNLSLSHFSAQCTSV